MPEDISALFTVSVYVEAMLGLLLLYTWVQKPEIRAVAWWGSAHLCAPVRSRCSACSGNCPMR